MSVLPVRLRPVELPTEARLGHAGAPLLATGEHGLELAKASLFEPPGPGPLPGKARALANRVGDEVFQLRGFSQPLSAAWNVLLQLLHLAGIRFRERVGSRASQEQQQRLNAPPPLHAPTQPLPTPPAPVLRAETTPVPVRSPRAKAAIAAGRAYLGRGLGTARDVGSDTAGNLHVTFQSPGDGVTVRARQSVVHLDAKGAPTGATLTEVGPVPQDGLFFGADFHVPPGIRELQLDHGLTDAGLSREGRRVTLDVGLWGPSGQRGYGGGNSESAITGEAAATRSYHVGPIEPGTWTVKLGKALMDGTPHFRVRLDLRTTPTLAPQPERSAYRPVTLSEEERWYQGDFHVHSGESGDAHDSLTDLVDDARARSLDFVHVSDHNVTTQADFLSTLQARTPDLLLMPGMEYTTYDGHVNAIGATREVDFFAGANVRSFPDAAAELAHGPERVLLSINHPSLAFRGMRWKGTLPPPSSTPIHGVEIANGEDGGAAGAFFRGALKFYEKLCAQGYHPAMLGGSDDHHAGAEHGLLAASLASPLTLVKAKAQSLAAIQDGIEANRTVVKTHGAADPMIDFTSSVEPNGDTVLAPRTTLRFRVSGGPGTELVLLKNGKRTERLRIPRTADSAFELEHAVEAPAQGEDRYRAEVWVDGRPRTHASYLWVKAPGASN